jgi:hypothetical protein
MANLEKRCSTCQLVRDVTNFNVRSAAADGLQSRCRECSRNWYVENKGEHIAKVRARTRRIRKDYQERLGAYLLDHPCVDCGETDVRVLDFDHEDPSLKLESVCKLVDWCFAWDRIEAEIAKCSVRCSNCHRRRTSTMFRDWRHSFAQRDAFDGSSRLAALLPRSR